MLKGKVLENNKFNENEISQTSHWIAVGQTCAVESVANVSLLVGAHAGSPIVAGGRGGAGPEASPQPPVTRHRAVPPR